MVDRPVLDRHASDQKVISNRSTFFTQQPRTAATPSTKRDFGSKSKLTTRINSNEEKTFVARDQQYDHNTATNTAYQRWIRDLGRGVTTLQLSPAFSQRKQR